jgi:hypothetical protein
MALPTELNLYVARGTDNSLSFTIKNDSGTAIDITNDTITFTAREDFAGPTKIPTKSNGVGQHSDPTNGITVFVVAKEDIDDEAFPAKDSVWKYEVRRIASGSGDEFVHYQGNFTVKPSVNG